MRAFGSILVLVSGAIALAGCGDSNRQALVDAGVQQCVQGMGPQGPNGMDSQRVCRCAVEKLTSGKSDEEVRAISQQKDPTPADFQAMAECVAEEFERK